MLDGKENAANLDGGSAAPESLKQDAKANYTVEVCSGYGQFHTNEADPAKPDKQLRPYVGISWSVVRAMVDNQQSVDKAQAQWLIPSILMTRSFREQEDKGAFPLLWADIDQPMDSLDALLAIAVGMLPGCNFEIYSTRSAKPGAVKARLLIWLEKPLSFADWRICQEVLNDTLAAAGIVPDRASERAAQLCYLPNRGEYYESRSKRDGAPFDPLVTFAAEIAAKRQALVDQARQLEAATLAATERRAALSLSDAADTIGAFNRAYTVVEILLRAGYTQRGSAFRHPHSQSGSFSATVKEGRVHSLSSSDPLYTGGGGGGAHDAFSAFAVLFAGGDRGEALKLAGDQWLAIGSESWNTVKRREHAQASGAGKGAKVGAGGTDGEALGVAIACVLDAIERTKGGDCGALFEPAAMEALRVVKMQDQAEFMRLRAAIKKSNKDVLVSGLDDAIRGGSAVVDREAADILVDLARAHCTFFHDADREPYASFKTDEHCECWHAHSRGFAEWLSYRFYKEEGRAPTESAIKTALATLAGQAKFDGEEKPVFVRVATTPDGAIWIDLCDPQWRAVRVAADGWRIVDQPPVMFVRSSSMRELPTPYPGGNLETLWDIVNVPEAERAIVVAWMIECFRSDTPYVVLELGGEQGAGKSVTQNLLRELIDPNQANNRAAPKNVEDVFIAARNSHLVSFENLSHLSPAYQDALCILATGGGFASRTLFSNLDETVLNMKKPVVLNGIAGIVTAQDLSDRTIHVSLPTVTHRLTAQQVQVAFDKHKMGIFGGLLDLMAKVLKVLPTVKIAPEFLPRMADFALLGEAVYRVRGGEFGAFLREYNVKREESVHRTLDASPVAVAALAYLDKIPSGFDGTVKGLFEHLTRHKPDGETWPRSAKGFADALRRVAPALRLIGINAKIADKPGMHGYTCVLKKAARPVDIPSGGPKRSNYVHQVHEVHAPKPASHELDEHHERGSELLASGDIYPPAKIEVEV